MKKIKIVTDSSADLLKIEKVDFSFVPLTIMTNEKEYVDDENLDVNEMLDDLIKYKGRSKTSCPNSGVWLDSFEGYDEIYVVTLTSQLSGSYNAANVAKQIYLESNPNAKIHIFDTLTVGPELQLLVEKIEELICENKEFEEIVKLTEEYLKTTRLYFSLESLHNFVQNGRVSKISEITSKLLKLKVIGKAKEGMLFVLNKCIGLKKAFLEIVSQISNQCYEGGKMRITHINNLIFASMIKDHFKKLYSEADIKICEARGLCSYYAENGGVLIGFETINK